MSRAFVKEPDSDAVLDESPERPVSPHPNYVTPAGFKRLEAELATLEKKRRAVMESAGELASKLSLGQIEREIRYLKARIGRAIPIDPAQQPSDKVCFGALVTVEDETGAALEFAIVGEDEAEAGEGKVSWVSPLAKALIGARVGDLVAWKRPAGDRELQILSIRYPGRYPGKRPRERGPKS